MIFFYFVYFFLQWHIEIAVVGIIVVVLVNHFGKKNWWITWNARCHFSLEISIMNKNSFFFQSRFIQFYLKKFLEKEDLFFFFNIAIKLFFNIKIFILFFANRNFTRFTKKIICLAKILFWLRMCNVLLIKLF